MNHPEVITVNKIAIVIFLWNFNSLQMNKSRVLKKYLIDLIQQTAEKKMVMNTFLKEQFLEDWYQLRFLVKLQPVIFENDTNYKEFIRVNWSKI